MDRTVEITLLGGLRVYSKGVEVSLPASRKARALLAFLVATGRPHRRERLCELFWDLPDDPKAALRWSLSKLRKVVDTPERIRIIADRERVTFDGEDVVVDLTGLHAELRQRETDLTLNDLERIAELLDGILLDGLDGAGDERFDAWLTAERDDVQVARSDVLRQLATHPRTTPIAADKWFRLWEAVDPGGAAARRRESATVRESVADDRSAERQGSEPVERHRTPRRHDGPTATAGATGLRRQALRAQRIRFCNAEDGTRIAYATIGSGAPLMKAANWLNHLEFDWDSPIWGRSFEEIAKHRTFVRYDERGCGLSDWDVKDLGFDAFVEDLEAVADELALERFPLLGISQGCAVAIEYAVRHPERVSGLVLIGGYAAGWRHHADEREQELREAVMSLTELGWGTDSPAYRQIFSQTFMPEASGRVLDWFNEFQRQTTSPRNAARFQEAFGHIDVRHRLPQVEAPTIVLHSRHDRRIPIELGRAVAAGIPDAQFVPLDSGNHILLDSEPAWQACVEAIGRFMTERKI